VADVERRRPWWRRKRWWAAGGLLWASAYCFSVGPAHYAADRGWLPQSVVKVYLPLDASLRALVEVAEALGPNPLLAAAEDAESAYHGYRHAGLRLATRHAMEEDVQLVIEALEREIESQTDPALRAARRQEADEWREKLADMRRNRWTFE
jgi:hypothetical protein